MQKFIKPNYLSKIVFSCGILFALNTSATASLSSKPATPHQILTAPTTKTSSASASQKIHNIYRQWAGTRYRLGGTTKAGIDCSAFVRETMLKAFNLNLPRSTAEQKLVGRAIKKSELRVGDLVFFRNNKHVGVYIGNGKFIHAGSSTGVTTASLSNSYWAKNYTQSRRVL